MVRDGSIRPKTAVLEQWKQSSQLLKTKPQARGWVADVLKYVEKLYATFTNENVYAFEGELAKMHPNNHYIRPKIRQQLQVLCELGLIERLSPGTYRRLG